MDSSQEDKAPRQPGRWLGAGTRVRLEGDPGTARRGPRCGSEGTRMRLEGTRARLEGTRVRLGGDLCRLALPGRGLEESVLWATSPHSSSATHPDGEGEVQTTCRTWLHLRETQTPPRHRDVCTGCSLT